MSQLSVSEIYAYARAAGFSPDQAVTWTAIAMAESGGRTVGLRGRPEPGRLPVHDLALDRQAVEADPMGDPPASQLRA